jgi:ABC-type dipeptide/oligopeptide/nickel transport system permease component
MRFGSYVFLRFISLFVQLFGALLLVYSLLEIVPYDPTIFLLFGFRGSEEEKEAFIAALRHEYGLDQPFYIRAYDFFVNLLTKGSLGDAWLYPGTVNDALGNSLPFTVVPFLFAFIMYCAFSIILGVSSGLSKDSLTDKFLRVFTLISYAIPSYIIGLWLVEWGEISALAPYPEDGPEFGFRAFKYLLLPVITIILSYTGYQFRLIRSDMIQILQQPYILTAKAKGLPDRLIIYKHALRNILPKVFNTISVTFPLALSSYAVLEIIFGIPGLGNLMVFTALEFDWPILVGISAVLLIINTINRLLVDIALYLFDPRLRAI